MIKYITNIANSALSAKIDVETRMVINENNNINFLYSDTTLVDNTKHYMINQNRFLFVKLKFNGLVNTDTITRVLFNLIAVSSPCNLSLKVYKLPNIITDFGNSASNLYDELDFDAEYLMEQVVVKGVGGYGGSQYIQESINFDLTELVTSLNQTNPEFIFVITSTSSPNYLLKIYDPADISDNGNVVVQGTSIENSGINSINKYDNYSSSSLDKGYINLVNGEVIHLFDTFSTLGKKMPISLSIAYNINRNKNSQALPYKFKMSYEYNIYLNGNEYIIEDYTGNKKCYYSFSKNDDNIDYNLLGIKHLDNDGDLYYCYEDLSYFYVTINGENGSLIFLLYDQNNNKIVFNVYNNNTQIKRIINSFNEEISFTWTPITNLQNMLTSITNSDGDSVSMNYNVSNMIADIIYVNENRKINLSYNYSNSFNIGLYNIENNNNVLIKMIRAELSSNRLLKVKECNYCATLMSTLEYVYSNDKISQVKIYDGSNNLLGQTSYLFTDGYTKTTNFKNDSIYHYFDKYGRLRTKMDEKGRTESFNYDEIKNGFPKGLSGKSISQCNIRNLIENNSFEYLDNNGNILSWEMMGLGTVELSDDSLYGGKCLHIKTTNAGLSLTQNIINVGFGTYKLKIKAKSSNHSNLDVRAMLTYTRLESVMISSGTSTTLPEYEHRYVEYSNDYLINLTNINDNWNSFISNDIPITSDMRDLELKIRITSSGSNDVYFDDVEFTNASQITRYNIIENGYLENIENGLPTGWDFVKNESDSIVAISSVDEHKKILGKYAMKFYPNEVDRFLFLLEPRKMYKTIEASGFKNDEFTFSVFAKCYATLNTNFIAYVKFYYEHIDNKKYCFSFEKNLSSWQLLSRSILAEDEYSYVEVGVEYDGPRETYFDAFQLCKGSSGSYYSYDSRGKLTDVASSDGRTLRISYNENKPKKIVLQDGSHFLYDYLPSGKLLKVVDANNNSITFEYGPNNDLDNITKTTIRSGTEEIINTFGYDLNDNLIQKVDEFNKTWSSAYDDLKRQTSSIYPNGFKEQYTYDNLSNLLTLSGFESINNITPDYKNTITRNYNLDNIEKITSKNGCEYSFSYDNSGRLISITYNDLVIQSFTYNEITNGINKNLVSTKTYGESGDLFSFNYDNEDRLSEVILNNTSIYEYEYNEYSQISMVVDKTETSNIKTRFYSYDLKGNLVKVTEGNNVYKYEYDNLGNLQSKIIESNDIKKVKYFDYDYEFNDYSKEGFLNKLGNNYQDEIIISDHLGVGESGLEYKHLSCEYVEDSNMNSKLFVVNDKRHYFIYDFDTLNSNRCSIVNGAPFSLDYWKSRFKFTKTFYMWFRPTGTIGSIVNLMKFRNSKAPNEIISSVDIDSNGYVMYSTEGSSINKCITTNIINLNQWNFLAVEITYKSPSRVNIILNGVQTTFCNIDEYVYNIDGLMLFKQTLTPIIPPPAGWPSNMPYYDYTMPIHFNIALIGISNNKYLIDDYYEMNLAWNKYYLNHYNNIKNNSTTILYNDIYDNSFEILSFNDYPAFTDGLRPYLDVSDIITFDKEKDTIFKYDNDLCRRVYKNYSNDLHKTLAYKLGLTTTGSISLWFKIDENIFRNRYVMSLSNSNTNKLSIYLNSSRDCYIVNNGNQTLLSQNVQLEVWHHLYITINTTGIRTYIDGTYVDTTAIDFTDSILYLGALNSDKSTVLDGYIDGVAYSKIYLAYNSDMTNYGRPITVGDKMDNLGRITERKITSSNSTLNSYYSFNKLRVSEETTITGEHYNYNYDDVGNISTITSNNRNEAFTYDNLGRLTRYNHNNNEFEEDFVYDSNGDIESITKKVNNVITDTLNFSYCDDRLEYVRDSNNNIIKYISYNEDNPFYPTSMTILGSEKVLNWRGKRLVSVGNNITYCYNDEGIRIGKITPNENTTFIIENSNIISMTKTISNISHRIDFNYDHNGMLFGLRYNNHDYFYVRDILGNILGVVNSNGNYIVKYSYTAFGECSKQIQTGFENDFIANNNPFVYKGYYLDEETGFYYLKSRYYDPTICRFISPDDFTYLDEESLIGINLYAYCNNNPIMYVDENGNVAFLVITAIVGAIICGIGAGAYSYSQGARGWEIVGWSILGALGGALAGAALGGCVSAALTGGFFSSWGAIKTGAYTIYSIGKMGGVGAAGYAMYDNFKNAFHYTNHIFWSGGELSMNGAKYLASDVDGVTLEMTNLGHFLTKYYSGNNFNPALWQAASQNFANQVPQGATVISVQNLAGINLSSMWATIEYPSLIQKEVEMIFVLLGEY